MAITLAETGGCSLHGMNTKLNLKRSLSWIDPTSDHLLHTDDCWIRLGLEDAVTHGEWHGQVPSYTAGYSAQK